MRGITGAEAAERFLTPSLSHLHSPYLMAGMKTAVDRIEAAIENKEPILIYGDYDVDGTTAIVILKTAIELCGGTAEFHVPHRIRDGYDMRDDVIEQAAAAGIRLIISVDMGIRAFAPAETARRLGVDLIVTDHHLPGPQGVPAALAVVNPNQEGCGYPCKELCGAGVAFKLAQALIERRIPEGDRTRLLKSFMKVVAIATIADAVPLIGENRVFAKLGLEGLRSPVNPGLKALLEVAKLTHGRTLNSGEVAFRIAPRINAAGRMDVARDVIELFSVKDPARAREIANQTRSAQRRPAGGRAPHPAIHHIKFRRAAGAARSFLHRDRRRRLAPRRDRHHRHSCRRTLRAPGAGDFAQWRGSARLGPFHSRISSAECARVVCRTCSRASADTPTLSASRCPPQICRNCGRVSTNTRAPA